MFRFIYKFFYLVFVGIIIVGCSLFDDGFFETKTDKVTREYVDSHRRITITEIPELTDGKILGKKLPNPYSMDVMSEAWEILHPLTREDPDTTEHNLEATHIYIRMLPEDASDVDWLLESDYEFFNYPLDYEILGDPDEYHDPSLLDSTVTWLYTVMPIDASLPPMDYEIVDVCYIPDDEPQNNNPNGLTPIEQIAFGLIGGSELNDLGDIDWEEPEPGDGTHPGGGTGGNGNLLQGDLTYRDSLLHETVGIKCVKVTLRQGVKTQSVYTDENGHYQMPNVFGASPKLIVTFQNSEGFSCHYGYRLYNGRYTKSIGIGLSWSIDSIEENKSWAMAIINNTAYEWYKYCETNYIQKPASDLRIKAIESGEKVAATLMMKHGMAFYATIAQIIEFLNGINSGHICTGPRLSLLSLTLQLFLPDIMVCGAEQRSSSSFYGSVMHELSHASHFQQLGTTNPARCLWWRDVFSYEASCLINYSEPYGFSTDFGNGLCGVTEMWAHAASDVLLKNKYNAYYPTKYWFKNKALEHLFDNGIISIKNAFDVLSPQVTNLICFNTSCNKHSLNILT